MAEASPKTNSIGLSLNDYKGGKSTLCAGCGHDSITNNIIGAFFKSGINPYKVAKMSGIGCSSKTPAYFMSRSHAFNSVHGRMPVVSTGAKVCNPTLKMIGVSGDGDTASIGIGSFTHMIRRNLPIVYLIENNGVYGLTKGQFSATAERGATLKTGEVNSLGNIDLCSLALELGCEFVARSFSGDTRQLVPLIAAALKHSGTAIIDIVSPCVTFNNHDKSTKSYDYVKDHRISLQELGLIDKMNPISIDYEEGQAKEVTLPDGSFLVLKKVDSREHDVTDIKSARKLLEDYRNSEEILTGLFYINSKSKGFTDFLNLPRKPLSELSEEDLRPQEDKIEEINSRYK